MSLPSLYIPPSQEVPLLWFYNYRALPALVPYINTVIQHFLFRVWLLSLSMIKFIHGAENISLSLPLSPFCCSIPFIHRPQFTHFFVDGYLSFWLFHSHPEPISHRVSHFIVIRLFCNYEVKLQASYKLWLCVFCFCLLDPDAQWQLLSIHLSNRSWEPAMCQGAVPGAGFPPTRGILVVMVVVGRTDSK